MMVLMPDRVLVPVCHARGPAYHLPTDETDLAAIIIVMVATWKIVLAAGVRVVAPASDVAVEMVIFPEPTPDRMLAREA